MKHNKTKYFLIPGLMVLLVSSFVSCKKFLEEKQVSSLTQDYFNNESGLNSLINGLYVYARVKHEWEANGARLIEPETDAYMTATPANAQMTSGVYGSDVSSIATGNVTNWLGSANSSYVPMGAYPHINNCNIALDVIDNGMPLAILDTSATAHMPDCLEMPYRPEIAGAGLPDERAHTYRLGGLTCLACDVIGDYSFDQALQVGQKLVFLDMSHYTMVKTSNFNGVRLPSIALRHPDGRYELVKRFGYETYRDRLS